MPSNDDVLVQILAAIKAGGGGTVVQGAPQTDATKPWYVKLLSGGVDIGAQIAAALAGIVPSDVGGGVKALPTASHAVGADVVAPGAAFPVSPTAVQAVLAGKDAANNAQPLGVLDDSANGGSAQSVSSIDALVRTYLNSMATNRPGSGGEIFPPLTLASAIPQLLVVARTAGVHEMSVAPLGTPSSAPLEAQVRKIVSTPVAITDVGITWAASTTVILTGATLAGCNVRVGQFVYNDADAATYALRVTAVAIVAGAVNLTLEYAYAGSTGVHSGKVLGYPGSVAIGGTSYTSSTFTQYSRTVTLTGTVDSNVLAGMLVYLDADGVAYAQRVVSVATGGGNTTLTLARGYLGTAAAPGAAHIASSLSSVPWISSNAPTPTPIGKLAVGDAIIVYADAAYAGAVVSATRVGP